MSEEVWTEKKDMKTEKRKLEEKVNANEWRSLSLAIKLLSTPKFMTRRKAFSFAVAGSISYQ